jgi:hypothetical protein
MKLILKKMGEEFSERILNSSKTFLETKKNLLDLIKQFNQTSLSVLEIARTLQTHYDAITELYAMYDELSGKSKNPVGDSKITLNKKEKTPNKPN